MSRRRARRFWPHLALLIGVTPVAWAVQSIAVVQRDRAFSVQAVTIQRGDTLHFQNEDEFGHQIYLKSPAFNFASDEKEPGENLDVVFPVPGVFEVRCEIHPKMLLTVTVR